MQLIFPFKFCLSYANHYEIHDKILSYYHKTIRERESKIEKLKKNALYIAERDKGN